MNVGNFIKKHSRT